MQNSENIDYWCRIAVIGSEGSMGRRYSRLLPLMGVEPVKIDVALNDSPDLSAADVVGAIIATPTACHLEMVEKCCDLGIHFLCEKPVVTSSQGTEEAERMEREANVVGYVVSNWAYTRDKSGDTVWEKKSHSVTYNNVRHGQDGLFWDCCQLIYLARDHSPTLLETAPFLDAEIDGQRIDVDDIELSYALMLRDWTRIFYGIHHRTKLWTMKDAVAMARAVDNFTI